jgi:hypothetical protein
MRFNFFSRNENPDPGQPAPQAPQPVDPGALAPQPATPPRPLTGRTFPADEVVWGIAIRNGFDELDDPWYHRGTTQHAYLEGNDNVAICGFRPPQSGPRTRRRSRLGLPSAGEHPMCGMCARMVVAPRPRVPIPVSGSRPNVPVPVVRPAALAPRASVAPVAIATPAVAPGLAPVSPWVRQRTAVEEPRSAVEVGGGHDAGLMARGVHTESNED